MQIREGSFLEKGAVMAADLPFQGSVDRPGGVVGNLHFCLEGFAGVPHEFGKPGQQDDIAARGGPGFGGDHIFTLHECVEDTNQGSALAGKILEVKQLEPGHPLGAQGGLHLRLIAERRPGSGSFTKEGIHMSHAGFFEAVAEDFQIGGTQNPGVFLDLPVIGEDLVLPGFMADQGNFQAGDGIVEVYFRGRRHGVQDTSVAGVGEGLGQAGMGEGGVMGKGGAGSHEEIGAAAGWYIADVVVGPHGVEGPRVVFLQGADVGFDAVMAAPDLISVREHHQ